MPHVMPAVVRPVVAAVLIAALAACAEGELEAFLSGNQTQTAETGADAAAPTADAAAASAGSPAQTTPIPEGPSLEGRREWAASLSAAAIDLTVTARDERAWGILWQLVGETPPGPLPEGAMAVGVFVSARRTDGYSIAIAEMFEEPNAVVVEWVETQPARGAPVARLVTAPFVVHLLPANAKPVRFVGSRSTASP